MPEFNENILANLKKEIIIHPGYALYFKGENDRVEVPDHVDFDFADEFSIEAWVKPDSTDALRVICQRGVEDTGWHFAQTTVGDGKWVLRVDCGGGHGDALSDSPPTGEWQHVIGIRDSDGFITLYVDGSVQADTGTRVGSMDSDYKVYVGIKDGWAWDFEGLIDLVRIYNKELSSAEVTTLYNSGTGVHGGDPLGDGSCIMAHLYNEGEGTEAIDSSGHGHTGTLLPIGDEPEWITGYVPAILFKEDILTNLKKEVTNQENVISNLKDIVSSSEDIVSRLVNTYKFDESIISNLKKAILADENIVSSLAGVHPNVGNILANLKKIIFQPPQNINSSLMSSPVFPPIYCLTEKDGSVINDGVWQADATPYFYWNTINWYFPVVGWDISMDEDLDDEIDITQRDIIINGAEASKGSGNWDVDLTKLQYQNKYEIYEIEPTTKTLEPAHATYDRYDVIYLDLDTESIGEIKIEKGLRAEFPTVPTPSSNHYLEICKILVRGGDTQIYDADITDLRDQKIEIIDYIEEGLSAGSHILKVRAIGINGVKSQVGEFNIKIINQDYEIAPIKIWKTSSKIIQLANGEYQTITDTPYLTWEDPNPIGVTLTYYITTDGTEPSITNYRWSTTNLYYDITDHLGEGTTNIKIKPIDNFDVAGKTETVTLVYGVESIEDDIVAVIKGLIYRQSEKEIQIHQVVMSLDNPWTCSFSLPTKKFDDSISINNDDDIQVYYNEILLFNGWIKELSRVVSTDGETITGRAIGVKGILNRTTWVHNDSSYHEYKEANTSVADRFNDILRGIPSYLIADKEGISQMDNILTEEKYAAVKIKPTLDSLIDKAGNYKYFIDQYKKFKVMNLDNLIPHNLYLAVESENISAHKHDPAQSGDYNITGSDLKFDTTGKYTRVVIEGAKKQYQGWCGTIEWLQHVEKGQPNKTTQFQMYVEPGHKVLGSLYDPPGASASIYASWRIAHHWDCSPGVRYKGTQYIKYNRVIQGAINVETKTGSVGVSSETYKKYCPDPTGLLEGPIPDELKKFRPASVMVYAAYERPERIKVSVGDPNAPKEKTLYILDEGFMYQRWYRDDTSLMTDYANKILAAKNYTKVNGQISLDDIYTEISLDKCINIQNSNYSELENLKAIIQNITFNFDRCETTLDLTTDYLGGLNTGLASQGGKIKTGGAPSIDYRFRRG